MIFSPNKHFLSFSNKQKFDKKIKRFSDLPTLIFFGMLAETWVFFFFFFLGPNEIYLIFPIFTGKYFIIRKIEVSNCSPNKNNPLTAG